MLNVFIATALGFGFLMGFHDSSNVVATAIASRSIAPRRALLLAALAELAGPFLLGIAVANTVGSGIINAGEISLQVALAALLAAILWDLLTWGLGIPSSSSHALIGGLIGSALIARGLQAVQIVGLGQVLLALFISPIIGLIMGLIVMRLIMFVGLGFSPRINNFFRKSQTFTLVGLALGHGSNAGQKIMGMIALGLLVSGQSSEFSIPAWTIAASAAAISLGTLSGGWRLIRTLGGRIFKVRPVHAFGSQLAAGSVQLAAIWISMPISTTQLVSAAVMGVGASEGFRRVRWQVAREMFWAWVLTIPCSALASAVIYWILTW
jgi:PiT family inorganic phosphate transporter